MAPQQSRSFAQLIWRRFKRHRLAVTGAVVIVCLIALSLLALPLRMALGVDATTLDLDNTLLGPVTGNHLLGTDELGRDVFLRLVHGGRVSLSVGIICALTSAVIGTLVGVVAGYYGGTIDALLMRIADAMLSIPVLPLLIVLAALDLSRLFDPASSSTGHALVVSTLAAFAIAIPWMLSRRSEKRGGALAVSFASCAATVATLAMFFWAVLYRFVDWQALQHDASGSVVQLILLIVAFGWMTVARLARAATLQLKGMEFVTAARALGASDARIVLVHIIPGALAPIIVATTLEVGSNILYEAALSFLGLGVKPPVPSWGNMLTNAQEYMYRAPLLALWPGLCIFLTVAAFNFLGDGLRDALDPRQVMKKR